MSMTRVRQGHVDVASHDTWTWWRTRQLRYNLALAAAGWLAYGATLGLHYAFGKPMWISSQDFLSGTLFLGVAYLLVMGVANVCYLVGPALEAWLRPADPTLFRETAYRMGFWGSVAAPFAFPAINLALLLSPR
jgi:hypothetical protein